jgi:hypothetical protein
VLDNKCIYVLLYVDKQLELAFRKDFGDVLSSPDDEVC